MRSGWIAFFCVLGVPSLALAQHSIEVERAAARSDFFTALSTYDQLPRKIVSQGAITSAARSAWALSLPERARDEFAKLVERADSTPLEKAQAYFSQGLLDFQEGNNQLAIISAERAIKLLEHPSVLRGRAYSLWAQALFSLQLYGVAEEKYMRALEEVSYADESEVRYLLGLCRYHLGKLDDAGADLDAIPLSHPRAAEALRLRSQVALDRGSTTEAAGLLAIGRREFPDAFLDSWVDYIALKGAVAEKRADKVQAIESQAGQRFPASDSWLILLNAYAEEFRWTQAGVSSDRATMRRGGAR